MKTCEFNTSMLVCQYYSHSNQQWLPMQNKLANMCKIVQTLARSLKSCKIQELYTLYLARKEFLARYDARLLSTKISCIKCKKVCKNLTLVRGACECSSTPKLLAPLSILQFTMVYKQNSTFNRSDDQRLSVAKIIHYKRFCRSTEQPTWTYWYVRVHVKQR